MPAQHFFKGNPDHNAVFSSINKNLIEACCQHWAVRQGVTDTAKIGSGDINGVYCVACAVHAFVSPTWPRRISSSVLLTLNHMLFFSVLPFFQIYNCVDKLILVLQGQYRFIRSNVNIVHSSASSEVPHILHTGKKTEMHVLHTAACSPTFNIMQYKFVSWTVQECKM